MIKCLAYVTPLNVKLTTPPEYQKNGMRLLKCLLEHRPDYEKFFKQHPIQIVEQLLLNMWDDEHFNSLFGFRIEHIGDEHTITLKHFSVSLKDIQVRTVL